ncbi:hypothetical protein F2P79_009129 [Pimephales promelas]|nr:hypothetical protein F2P79_009129 [Pimephales promelas]
MDTDLSPCKPDPGTPGGPHTSPFPSLRCQAPVCKKSREKGTIYKCQSVVSSAGICKPSDDPLLGGLSDTLSREARHASTTPHPLREERALNDFLKMNCRPSRWGSDGQTWILSPSCSALSDKLRLMAEISAGSCLSPLHPVTAPVCERSDQFSLSWWKSSSAPVCVCVCVGITCRHRYRENCVSAEGLSLIPSHPPSDLGSGVCPLTETHTQRERERYRRKEKRLSSIPDVIHCVFA